eukprot:1818279-Amphidinium_carterae.1
MSCQSPAHHSSKRCCLWHAVAQIKTVANCESHASPKASVYCDFLSGSCLKRDFSFSQDCNAVDEPVVTADAARADSTHSCVDVLIASLCLWETISSPCKARMWIPLATSLQVKAMDPQHHFSITSLPAETLEKGMVVESIVHCTPEGCVDFLDPVLLQLPLPHLNTSKGFQIVTREHGAKGWRLYLEEADFQIHDGMVCFTAQHFCDLGIKAGKLHENEENWFTFTPHIQYCPSDGLCDVKCLVLARDCGKCQYIANQMREDSSCLR